MDAATRRQVRERACDRCEYCRMPQAYTSFLPFHVEHIEASQHVADDSLDNLCWACPHCNLNKGPNLASLSEETRELTRLFHPRRDVWAEHFRMNGAAIEGVTDVGRATTRLLKMNAPDRVQIRAGLLQRGEF